MADSVYGFAAARDLRTFPVGFVEDQLDRLPYSATYVTGGAVGGDALIGLWLFRHRPLAEHKVVVPANQAQVDWWWQEPEVTLAGVSVVEVIGMPRGSTYKDRNAEIVGYATHLWAFPAYPEDHPRSSRSGTWQTVRLARMRRQLVGWPQAIEVFVGSQQS